MNKNMIKIIKELKESNIDCNNLLYCPEMPVVMGMERSFIIEELMGMRIARLVSVEEEK